LLSAGVDFEQFEPQVVAACEGGASGFLAGRAIWKEGVALAPDERQAFIAGTATDRLKRLLDITQDKARCWTEFYTVSDASENWFESY
jgi:tagatose-1,6-bisphosphate aldolase